MYLYVRGATYDYVEKQRKLKKASDDYISELKRVSELPPNQVSQNLPRLKKLRDEVDNMVYDLRKDEVSKASTREALEDLLDSGLKDIPRVLEQYLHRAGYNISVPYGELTISDFEEAYDGMSESSSHNGARGKFGIDIIPRGTLCDAEGLDGRPASTPKQVEKYMNDYIKKVVDASRIPMVEYTLCFWAYINYQGTTRKYILDKYDYKGWWDVDDLGFRAESDVPDMNVELLCFMWVYVGREFDYYGEVLDGHPELDSLDDKVLRAKPNLLKKSRSTSSEWSKTIDLRDYFPEEAFDEEGEFNTDLTTENDWIDFNMDHLQYGFGNAKKLYLAVLNKAGVPPYLNLVQELDANGGVDNNGNMEFVMHIPAVYDTVEDIYFGFDMDINGDKATVTLSYANAE